ncbi:DUF7577 domain-containing protein [Natronoglomus mannanivorans]|uniref:DUF7577 domain-containing protein n=1 Tax=Natronoglomus mannanivorans TaxID=2979990 RepID=A0AAP2Z2F1_9EURY|nr:hypothetical protein [Halobacteria archaeon AArc-xg1-1]
MELWSWLVGYLILFAILHLLLYYYYVRREDDHAPTSHSFADGNRSPAQYSSSSDASPRSTEEPDVAPEIDGETIDCPYCGVENEADQTYTYCWNCVSTLRT